MRQIHGPENEGTPGKAGACLAGPPRSTWRLAPLWVLLLLLSALHGAAAAPQTVELLVCSYGSNQILRYDGTTGAFLNALAGVATPTQMTVGPDKNLYVIGNAPDPVYRYNGITEAYLGIFVASDGTSGSGVGFGPDGNLYTCDTSYSVKRYDAKTGALLGTFASANVYDPTNFAWGKDGYLYVGNEHQDSITRYNGTTGAYVDTFVASHSGGLTLMGYFHFGPDGNIYIPSAQTNSVKRYSGKTGAYIDDFVAEGSGGLQWPSDAVFGPDGNLYVASYDTNQVLKYNGSTGAFIGVFVAAGSGGLAGPQGLLFRTLTPPGVSGVTLNPSTVTGGLTSVGRVTLTAEAGPGGVTVTLTSSNPAAATVPATLTIPVGATSQTFLVQSSAVAAATSTTIKAAVNGSSKSATLKVQPLAVAALNFSPTTVEGGTYTFLSIALNGPAPSGGAVVTLTNSDTTDADVPATVTIPAGSPGIWVLVNTNLVSASAKATVTGTLGGSSKSATLKINP
jgi:hypothetical protein